jgi:hypothetical protein
VTMRELTILSDRAGFCDYSPNDNGRKIDVEPVNEFLRDESISMGN